MRCKRFIMLITAFMILSISNAMAAPNFILMYLMLLTAFIVFLASLILIVQEYTGRNQSYNEKWENIDKEKKPRWIKNYIFAKEE